jgi:hypothetical protein
MSEEKGKGSGMRVRGVELAKAGKVEWGRGRGARKTG